MSQSIQEMFTQISSRYDFLNRFLSFNLDQHWRTKTIQSIQFDANAPLVACDLCAGTLDLSLAFLLRFGQSQVMAVDFSLAMLQNGLKKITPPLQNKIHPMAADALKLPFPDKTFDVIFCGYGFRNLDDKTKGLSEMHRVLKPGGQLLILEFFKPTGLLSQIFHATYGRFFIPWLGALISKNRGAYTYLRDSIQGFYSLNEFIKLITNHGFDVNNFISFFMGVSSLVVGVKK